MNDHTTSEPAPGTGGARAGLALCLIFTLLFAALCVWQIERRAWKLDLIERVDARVHAAPSPPPPRADWPSVSAQSDEYRHVALDGVYLPSLTLTQAVTKLGPGYWLLQPLRQSDGTIVLVNRGFVAADAAGAAKNPTSSSSAAAPGAAHVTGLLRLSEPGGGFLRRNDPASKRWYSRDVQAIAAAQGLPADRVAPYFVDADADASPVGSGRSSDASDAGTLEAPVAGLTVVSFRNSHLTYALTWFALALLNGWGAWRFGRELKRARQARQ